ncbi:MAG TPA: ABC transporter permease [Ilumatobacter sp.]|nr:ABC transporter permease [Ilumatobacter sp.]
MIAYVVRRLLVSIPLLLVLSIVSFIATRAVSSPEAGIRSNPRVSPEDIQRYREQLGLDDPASTQYLRWLGNLLHGDLGTSLVSNRDVWPQLRSALWNTAVLGITALVFSFAIGVGIGVLSAVKRGTTFDYAATGAAFFGLSMPNFWFAIMLQLLFGVYLVDWLALDGPVLYTAGTRSPGTDGFDPIDRLRHLALPAMVLAVQLVAVYSRYMRASLLEVLGADYVRTARAKGASEGRVVGRHAMRNAMIPVTTQLAGDVGAVFGGLVITETVFQWPGMGPLFLDAMQSGDYQVILPWLMITAFAVVFFNLLADLAYGVLDPRIRHV